MAQLFPQSTLGSLLSNNSLRVVIGLLLVEVNKLKYWILMSKLENSCRLKSQVFVVNNTVYVANNS